MWTCRGAMHQARDAKPTPSQPHLLLLLLLTSNSINTNDPESRPPASHLDGSRVRHRANIGTGDASAANALAAFQTSLIRIDSCGKLTAYRVFERCRFENNDTSNLQGVAVAKIVAIVACFPKEKVVQRRSAPDSVWTHRNHTLFFRREKGAENMRPTRPLRPNLGNDVSGSIHTVLPPDRFAKCFTRFPNLTEAWLPPFPRLDEDHERPEGGSSVFESFPA